MSERIEDWKITVYALGELEGEDREAVERAVAEDPELAARVEAIRRQADDVAFTLSAEPLPEPRPRYRSTLPRRMAALAALAAILVIAWSATWGVQRPRPASEKSDRATRARQLLDEGLAAFKDEDYERARDLLARAVAADATNQKAAMALSLARMSLRRQQEEIAAMRRTAAERLLQQEADRAVAARRALIRQWFEQALVCTQEGRYKDAEDLCNDCLALDPDFQLAKDFQVDSMRAYHNKTYATHLKTKVERWQLTMSDIDECTTPYADDDLVRWPSTQTWETVRARPSKGAQQREDLADLHREFAAAGGKRASSEVPDRAAEGRLLEAAGIDAFKANDYERAKDILARAVESDPTNEGARRLLEDARLMTGEYTSGDRARREVAASEARVRAQVAEIETRYNRGVRAMNQKDYAKAVEEFGYANEASKWFPYNIDLSTIRKQSAKFHEEAAAMHEIQQAELARDGERLTQREAELADRARFEARAMKTVQLFQQAQDALERGHYDLAERVCDDILSIDPNSFKTSDLKSIIRHAQQDGLARWNAMKQLEEFRRQMTVEKIPPQAETILFPSREDWDRISSRQPRGFGSSADYTSDATTAGFDERATWGSDSNEDLFGGRDIEVYTSPMKVTPNGTLNASTSGGGTITLDAPLSYLADMGEPSAWASKGYMRVAPREDHFIQLGGVVTTTDGTEATLGKLAVDPSRVTRDRDINNDGTVDIISSGFVGAFGSSPRFDLRGRIEHPMLMDSEGSETGAVTNVTGHGPQITISAGIDIDSVWRADNLAAILNREGAAAGAFTAGLRADDSDSDSFWSPMVNLRFDAYLSRHVTGVIELENPRLGPRPPAPPEAALLMAPRLGDIPVLGTLAIITAPEGGEARPPVESPGTEGYAPIVENPFMHVSEEPLTTFSIDVDTASYANVRRFLHTGKLPPPDAVRIEEVVNYFPYDYAPPTDNRPFAVHLEMASCPWKKGHRLLRVGLKGRVPEGERPASNLVFLVDVSGSMEASNKLPLVRAGLRLLVKEMSPRDRIAIVTYAGESGVALPSTPGNEKEKSLGVLDSLRAGGSTNGASGVQLAYGIASAHFIVGGTNRVVLATDGDWNVGVTSHGDLVRLIEEKAKSGVFLTVLGFGMGNLKDDTLEKLADKGNGNYAYVDSLSEAQKVLVEEMDATLRTIAKDVKIQIEFNPARIAGYRLIGYENRVLAKQDFADDKKDAGEIGAGHAVTALYEVVPVGEAVPGQAPPVPPLRYQTQGAGTAASNSTEACIVKLRYKAPESDTSALIEVPFEDKSGLFDDASEDFRFATAVAGYGMLLRKSQHAGGLTWDGVAEIAAGSVGKDPSAYRAEFVELVKLAEGLAK